MKNVLKNILLIILIILLASTFFEKQSTHSSSLENDIVIVDSGIALESTSNELIEEDKVETSTNMFAKIGQMITNILIKIAEFISKIVSSIFLVFLY